MIPKGKCVKIKNSDYKGVVEGHKGEFNMVRGYDPDRNMCIRGSSFLFYDHELEIIEC